MGRKAKKVSVPILALSTLILFAGCGTKEYKFDQPYDIEAIKITYPQTVSAGHLPENETVYFASSLCVGENIEIPDAGVAEAAGVFHEASGTITYSQNIFEKLHPASTTKILTAYLALKYGNLSDEITVSANAGNQSYDSSVCGIHEGDRLTLEQLLHGLLMMSGNDAAVAIAEYISGSVEEFAELMNKEAAALGATNSHFVNPHGLTDEDHYTCVYDLYLLFHAALKNEEFEKIIHTTDYTVSYYDGSGQPAAQDWTTTNKFLLGETPPPDGITVVGGKTGTTQAAGYCLVLYSYNAAGEPVISIVLKADSRDNLYLLMTDLLDGYAD